MILPAGGHGTGRRRDVPPSFWGRWQEVAASSSGGDHRILSGQAAPWPSRATSSRVLAVGAAVISCPITSGLSHTWLRNFSRKPVAASLVSKSRSTATLFWSSESRNSRTDLAPEAARPAGSLSNTFLKASPVPA